MNQLIRIGKIFTRQSIRQKRIRWSILFAFLISALVTFMGYALFIEMQGLSEVRVRYDDK